MIKILLVEDDKIIVASLSEYLNSEGYLVRSVSGQAAAMKLLAEEKADLVLLDVSLAEGNGFAACRAIKAEFDIPVIFLTASGDEFSTVIAMPTIQRSCCIPARLRSIPSLPRFTVLPPSSSR